MAGSDGSTIAWLLQIFMMMLWQPVSGLSCSTIANPAQVGSTDARHNCDGFTLAWILQIILAVPSDPASTLSSTLVNPELTM